MRERTNKLSTKSLQEILGKRRGAKVCDILSKAKSSSDAVNQLREYYHTIEDHLKKQGLDPDYLAFATVAACNQFIELMNKAINN